MYALRAFIRILHTNPLACKSSWASFRQQFSTRDLYNLVYHSILLFNIEWALNVVHKTYDKEFISEFIHTFFFIQIIEILGKTQSTFSRSI